MIIPYLGLRFELVQLICQIFICVFGYFVCVVGGAWLRTVDVFNFYGHVVVLWCACFTVRGYAPYALHDMIAHV